MPTFPTRAPITLRVSLGDGLVNVTAEATDQTTVEIHPSDAQNPADIEHATNTTVDHRGDTITVQAPKTRGGRTPSIEVHVRLPEGSDLELEDGSADLWAQGRLGAVDVEVGSADVTVDEVMSLAAKTGSGNVLATRVADHAEVKTGSGDVAMRQLDGWAELATASGDCAVEFAGGRISFATASGDARIGEAHQSVEGRTASGDIIVRQAHAGVLSFNSASGSLHLGVAAGTATLLDVSSLTGNVRSGLESASAPDESDARVEIRARTVSGDVEIVRAS